MTIYIVVEYSDTACFAGTERERCYIINSIWFDRDRAVKWIGDKDYYGLRSYDLEIAQQNIIDQKL
jgi:hypothetical protein